MKTFPANIRVRGFTAQDNANRYKLHRQIRKKDVNCKIFAKSRTITIPLGEENINPLLMELVNKYGYKIQVEAFTINNNGINRNN
ncbi:hypothetical protein EG359_17285 [Chryseobacterium joostei]|uniref:Uncharacterized protein n=1 Tax=Chryseobacterium joostei TaxID=112234 RepID=A0A1N7IB07_9FLAO|nr:hypothetical protein [Chryseobacterium joostei]AZB01257.1 hypothetical protein EG359_17285 [Chryseobacterium joostei]SIS34233.1 hypothetical protein SAMN05421768_103656 [Chryseobacterium joostei]